MTTDLNVDYTVLLLGEYREMIALLDHAEENLEKPCFMPLRVGEGLAYVRQHHPEKPCYIIDARKNEGICPKNHFRLHPFLLWELVHPRWGNNDENRRLLACVMGTSLGEAFEYAHRAIEEFDWPCAYESLRLTPLFDMRLVSACVHMGIPVCGPDPAAADDVRPDLCTLGVDVA